MEKGAQHVCIPYRVFIYNVFRSIDSSVCLGVTFLKTAYGDSSSVLFWDKVPENNTYPVSSSQLVYYVN
jgi:hypothetical protein